jgi:L-aminopeptidase/D-esterase-like protein
MLLATGLAAPCRAQDSASSGVGSAYWRRFGEGAVTSILLHEAAHIATSIAVGGHPTFGFDKLRPTIYSGINTRVEPHKQFLFSAAGLTVQSLLDEGILDIPHARGSAFERGILGGGIGTTLFYLTIGRTGSVSDVDFMARTHALTKTQVTLIFGSVAALQSIRIARDPRYANFFVGPAPGGGVQARLGFALP